MSSVSEKARPEVTVLTVTYEAERDLPGFFDSVAGLTHRPLSLLIVDCASRDGSVAIAREQGRKLAEQLAAEGRAEIPVTVVPLGENRGFAGGINAGLALTGAPYVLSLNADARPEPGYVTALLARLEERPRAAAATGRLVRAPSPGGDPAEPPRLDACGMRLTLTWRHLDRGSGEADRGQLAEAERVFGGTGAATLFRRAALDDVAIGGEIFDPRFHSFREDAELAFRFAERGWEVIYEPAARALHRRRALPERRSKLPAMINYHSLKNRYLLRIYHQTLRNFLLTFVPTLARDLGALGWVLARERTSLAAYRWLWTHRRELIEHRRKVQARRTRPARELDAWFFRRSRPLGSEHDE